MNRMERRKAKTLAKLFWRRRGRPTLSFCDQCFDRSPENPGIPYPIWEERHDGTIVFFSAAKYQGACMAFGHGFVLNPCGHDCGRCPVAVLRNRMNDFLPVDTPLTPAEIEGFVNMTDDEIKALAAKE